MNLVLTASGSSRTVMFGCLVSLFLLWGVQGRLQSQQQQQQQYPSYDFQQEDLEPNPSFLDIPDVAIADNITRNFLSATLGSNMVLQRDQTAVLWGYTQPGTNVTTSLYEYTDSDNHYDTEHLVKEPRLVYTATTTATARISSSSSSSSEEEDGLWRQALPPQGASLTPTMIHIKSSTGQQVTLDNVLFGDVYLCGGQSNMQFAMPAQVNGSQEATIGNNYPHIRLFTVGTGTRSSTPMPDLQTVLQPWSVASNKTLSQGGGFNFFSAVCWFFGKQVADGLDNQVPIGLISNNWGGTAVERWSIGGDLYNAMINPYVLGPMANSGFIWYQGEANTGDQGSADRYAQTFPTMIEQWRAGFQMPDAYFGFIQLSTWCPKNPAGVAEMRQAQMAALKLSGKIGYATNADHGAGCNIHPPEKRPCGQRLGNSALALQYGKQIQWRSPTYAKATSMTAMQQSVNGPPSVVVEFYNVSDKGLYLLDKPFNDPISDTCSLLTPGTCAWPMVLLNGKGWTNATVSIQDSNKVVMTPITPVDGNDNDSLLQTDTIVATSYGWSAIPIMTIYDAGTDLPVLPWNEKL